jgi:hypothetical protein
MLGVVGNGLRPGANDGGSTAPHPNAIPQPIQGGRTESGHPSQILHSTERAVGLPIPNHRKGPGRPDPGEGVQRRDISLVQVDRVGGPGPGGSARLTWGYRQIRWRGRGAGEGKVGAKGGQEPRAHAGDPIEPARPSEWPVGLAIRHDPLGERQTHPGEAGQLGSRGPVGIDPLVRAKRAGQGQEAVTVGGRRARRKRAKELHLAGRVARAGEPPAHPLADEPEREQQQQRTTLGGGHRTMVAGERLPGGGGILRGGEGKGGRGKDGKTEGGRALELRPRLSS